MSYYVVNTKVIFPKNRGRNEIVFNTVNSFKIETSWKNLTDTAEVVIAKKLFFEEKQKVFELIKAGDPIVIMGGYNGELREEFRGYVAEILDDTPLILKCEDNMYILKRTPVNKSYKSVKLENLLKDMVGEKFQVEAYDVELGSLLLSNTTATDVLQMLKDDYGLYCYFDGDTLVGGKIYGDRHKYDVVKYSFDERQCNIIKNDLKYHTKDMIKIKVTMTAHNAKGKKLHVTVGDKDGQEQKLICTNVEKKETLEALAKKELDRLKYDGYQGSITSFAIPYVRHGYVASIVNKTYPEREGRYYIDSIVTTLSDMGAYHKQITLGPAAA